MLCVKPAITGEGFIIQRERDFGLTVHIVDPRPYVEHAKDVLRTALHRDDAPEVLARLSAEGIPGANWMLANLVKYTATSVLMDSTAVRVNQLGRALGRFPISHPFFDSAADISIDPIEVEDFDDKPRSLLREVTAWTAKSAAAFESALHCINEMEHEIESFRYFPEQLIKRRMESRVLDRHAYDEGHPRHIQLLEDARTNILETLSTPGSWPPTRKRTRATGYSQFDSRECYFGQAADIAAGLARHVYETEKLVTIVSRFEHVTHNGERMSLKGAEEQMRRTQLGNGWRLCCGFLPGSYDFVPVEPLELPVLEEPPEGPEPPDWFVGACVGG